ncbi:hypothetical protein KSS87_010564, partial [Heliosperma pusillum]
MDYLSNAFSVLGFEDGDDPSSLASTSDAGLPLHNRVAAKVEELCFHDTMWNLGVSEGCVVSQICLVLVVATNFAPSLPTSYPYGTSNSKGKSSSDKLAVENGNNKDQKLSALVSEFRLPLVWIDLEMTGLNIEVDRIVEIACIITDGSLSKSVEGPDLVIHQSKECLDVMNEWCQNHHAASGLTKEVLESTVDEREAEKQVISFVKRHVGTTHRPLLAGNSIYVDFIFLKKYMPDLASIFSHVLVDVSSIKALCIRWYPRGKRLYPVWDLYALFFNVGPFFIDLPASLTLDEGGGDGMARWRRRKRVWENRMEVVGKGREGRVVVAGAGVMEGGGVRIGGWCGGLWWLR